MIISSTYLKRNFLHSAIFLACLLQVITSCKKIGSDPTSSPEENSTTVYKDVEYISGSGGLSVARAQIQTTTIGSKSYFIGGAEYNPSYIPFPISTVIDVFDSNSLSWSTDSFPLPSRYNPEVEIYTVAGSKLYFNKPIDLNSPTIAINTIDTYDVVNKEKVTYEMGIPRFVNKILAVGRNKAAFIGGKAKANDFGNLVSSASYAVDIIDLTTKNKLSTRVPDDVSISDAAFMNEKIYFTAYSK